MPPAELSGAVTSVPSVSATAHWVSLSFEVAGVTFVVAQLRFEQAYQLLQGLESALKVVEE